MSFSLSQLKTEVFLDPKSPNGLKSQNLTLFGDEIPEMATQRDARASVYSHSY